jgi:hypothetical protein
MLVQIVARAIAVYRDAHASVTRADIEAAAKLLTLPFGPLARHQCDDERMIG